MLLSNYSNIELEAGCDEAGRGCLAGPVFAAAVILPAGYKNSRLNDSKLLTAEERENLRLEIESIALGWAVAQLPNTIIDEINILNASIQAMHLAIDKLKPRPAFLIIDGNRFKPYRDIPHICIIKGDAQYNSIAAASILAKTHRDEFMSQLHSEYPGYGWDHNKGYATAGHRKAIMELGICNYHRKSFRLYEDLKLF